MLILTRTPLPGRRSWPGLAVLGFLLLGLGNGGVIWAEQTVPSGLTAVLVAITPFWMVGIESFLSAGEKITRRHIAGLVVGFCGILLLVWPDLWMGGSRATGVLTGLVALQVASFGWALGSSYSRRHAREENALSAAALEMIFGGAFLMIGGTVLGEWKDLAFTAKTAWSLAYLIFAGSIVGFVSYIYALKHLPVSTVSLYAYINPVIAVLLGTILLDEPFGARVILAGALVFLGSAVVRWSATRGKKIGTQNA